jgi:hypothetical protein
MEGDLERIQSGGLFFHVNGSPAEAWPGVSGAMGWEVLRSANVMGHRDKGTLACVSEEASQEVKVTEPRRRLGRGIQDKANIVHRELYHRMRGGAGSGEILNMNVQQGGTWCLS